MKYLTIDYIKSHSRLDYDCEDALIELYANAAEDMVLTYIRRRYQDLTDEYGQVPDAIMHATLMLCDHGYTHRSPVSMQNLSEVKYSFDWLVKPYMRLTDGEDELAQPVALGSDAKILFTAMLPDGLILQDVDFTVRVYNADEKDAKLEFEKSGCIEVKDNVYAVVFNTGDLGVGYYRMRISCKIQDTDFPSGFRTEIVKFNPHIRCTG